MTMQHDPELRMIKLAFLEAIERGDTPAAWIGRYPQHALALTDLALAASSTEDEPSAALVSRAADFTRTALAAHLAPQPVSLGERVKALGLTMRAVAAQVRLSSDVLVKLDRRVVPVETVPVRLLDQLGQVLGCTADALRLGLGGAMPQTTGAMYHAKAPPTVGQQSFADAVRTSVTLAKADREYWLEQA